MTSVLPFSDSSSLTRGSSLTISCLPKAMMVSPFFQISTKPSENHFEIVNSSHTTEVNFTCTIFLRQLPNFFPVKPIWPLSYHYCAPAQIWCHPSTISSSNPYCVTSTKWLPIQVPRLWVNGSNQMIKKWHSVFLTFPVFFLTYEYVDKS